MKTPIAFTLAIMTLAAPVAARADDISHLSFGLGAYDSFGDDTSVDLRVEYRPGVKVLIDNLNPWAGLEITTHASTWVGGGLLYEYQASSNVYIVPSIGAGIYSDGGSDADLGDSLQYRMQLELDYKFQSGYGVSAALSSMTDFDSDSGDADSAETLGVYWHVPFNWIFKTDN